MHLYSSFLPHIHESSVVNFNAHLVPQVHQDPLPNIPRPAPTALDSWHPPQPHDPPSPPPLSPIPNLGRVIPETELVNHAPGWTIFRNLYMADGTLFIVSSNPDSFPSIDFMTSTGLPALATPESIAERMPTDREIAIITPQEAHQRWGGQSMMELNNVFPVEGSTVRALTLPSGSSLTSESRYNSSFSMIRASVSAIPFPSHLTLTHRLETVLNHYYHFCAELLLGAWAFWHGTFGGASSTTPVPPLTRAIFPHATAEEWRDGPGMNFFFLRSAWPSLTVETKLDWSDRVSATALRMGELQGRAWWFDTVLLADRSAAFRGPECGEHTQRTAAEAVKGVVSSESRTGFLERGWWEPVRHNVLRFAGVSEHIMDIGKRAFKRASYGSPRTGGVEEVVVTYISRQAVKRHLIAEDHEGLVDALTELCERRGWELNIVAMEKISKEEQLALAARTTVSTISSPVTGY
jgi:hypothetical protein